MNRLADIALSYVGTKEIPGPKHNPTIVGWIRKFGRNLRSRLARLRDETAWCAVFVSAVLHQAGFPDTGSALAISYATYGKPTRFKRGAIIVIKRKRKGKDEKTGSRAGYHVGFLLKVTRSYYVIVGGNQRNQVKVSWYPRRAYAVIAVREPLAA